MKRIRHIFAALAKKSGIRAAAAVAIICVIVSFGAVGFAGYKTVSYFQQKKQGASLDEVGQGIQNKIEQNGNKAGATSTMPADIEPEPTSEPPAAASQLIDDLQGASDLQTSDAAEDTSEGNTSAGNEAAMGEKQAAAVQARRQRLKAANAESTALQNSLIQNALLQTLLQNSLLQNTLPGNTAAGSGTGTSNSGNSGNSGNTGNAGSGTGGAGQIVPTPAPTEPVFINKKAQLITPYVLDGTAPTLAGSYYPDTYQEIFSAETYPEGIPTKKYTIMLYFCGTDLEVNGGAVTGDLETLIKNYSYDNMDDVNILLCAGGTSKWKNEYMGAAGEDGCNNDDIRCNIYYLDPASYNDAMSQSINASTCKLLGSYDSTDMGDDKLLSGFMNYCTDNFPAENYGMVMWNHGGGINNGVCFSESLVDENGQQVVEGTGILAEELESALASSNLYKNQEKLAFLGYDACLMGGIEQAYMVSPYTDYMLGSSEMSRGDWNYDKIVKYIIEQSKNDAEDWTVKNKEIAKKIVELYYQEHGGYEAIASLACFDSAKMQQASALVNDMSKAVSELYKQEDMQANIFHALKQARIHTNLLGGVSGRENAGYNEAVDLGEFLRNLDKQFENLQNFYQDDAERCQQLALVREKIQAAYQNQEYLSAYGIRYNEKNIYEYDDKNGTVLTSNGDYWNALKGAYMSAASIYVPYLSPDLSRYYDIKVMEDYTALMKSFSDDINADQPRVKRLAAELAYAKMFENQTVDGASPSYISMKKAGDISYLQAQLKENYAENEKPVDSEGTALGYTPYTDFMDTIDKMTVYVSRYQAPETKTEEAGAGDTPAEGLNIVYGCADVILSNISASQEAVNISTETISNIIGYMVQAYDQVKYDALTAKGEVDKSSSIVYDWASLSGLEQRTDEKNQYLNALGEIYTGNQTASWLSFTGKVGKAETAGETEINYAYRDAYLFFYNSGDSENTYKFAGAACQATEEQAELDTMNSADLLNTGYSVIQFYHYIVDGNGSLTAVENSDKKDSFTAPVLAIDNVSAGENNMSMYKKDLTSDNSKYNDYTIGFTAVSGTDAEGNKTNPQSYIIPSGNAPVDASEYENNSQQIGATVSAGDNGAVNNQLLEQANNPYKENAVAAAPEAAESENKETTITAGAASEIAAPAEPVIEPVVEAGAASVNEPVIEQTTAPAIEPAPEPSAEPESVPTPIEALPVEPVVEIPEDDAA